MLSNKPEITNEFVGDNPLLVCSGRLVYQDHWQKFYSQVVASFTLSKEIRNSNLCQSKKFNSFFVSVASKILNSNFELESL